MARLAFLGSPTVAAGSLRALVEGGHEIVLVVSGRDRRRGRGAVLSPTPVKAEALALGLPVSDRASEVAGSGAELGVVVAFGQILKPDLLAAVPMVNVHFSLLPRWRGAAPVERAILAGDATTGVCLMAVEAGLDTGGLYACAETAIGPEETADELRARLGTMGAELLVGRLARGYAGLGEPRPQVGEATYAAKITPEDLRLDFSRPAVVLHRQVRAGRAHASYAGRRLIVHRARVDDAPAGDARPGTIDRGRVATGTGWLVPLEVQAEGRRRQDFEEWVRGARVPPGARLA